jgi:hypothetical protein
MIFHTAADSRYYECFYSFYQFSIKKFYPEAKLSLHYMGDNTSLTNNIDFLSREHINLDIIKQRYSPQTEKDALGYYALSRWLFLPLQDDHIIVSDVDIMAIRKLPQNINELLEKNQVINITRTKKDHTEGGMAMIIIHKDIADKVKEFANNLLLTDNLYWELDVNVKKFLYNNFSKIEIPEMHVFNKHSDIKIFDNTTRSFAIRKGRVHEKINTLQEVMTVLS